MKSGRMKWILTSVFHSKVNGMLYYWEEELGNLLTLLSSLCLGDLTLSSVNRWSEYKTLFLLGLGFLGWKFCLMTCNNRQYLSSTVYSTCNDSIFLWSFLTSDQTVAWFPLSTYSQLELKFISFFMYIVVIVGEGHKSSQNEFVKWWKVVDLNNKSTVYSGSKAKCK